MLSRVADTLYWMSRYIERAENVARILDVNIQLMLDLPANQTEHLQKNWLPIVACLGDEPTFRQRHRKTDSTAVTEFLVFDREHPNSILGSLSQARENARTAREQISTEMWEQLNGAYLWCVSKPARQAFERNQYEFFQRIKTMLQLFQGITDTSMVHNAGWEFIQIGKHLERADKTSRVLDDTYHIVRSRKFTPSDELLQWVAVLRSCSARQAYQRIYAAGVQPKKIAALLLLHESFPRSVRFCVKHLDEALRRLSGVAAGQYSNAAEKLSGRLFAELSFSDIEEICHPSLHQAMDLLQIKLNQIGDAIYQSYIHPPLPRDEEAARRSEVSQQ